MLFRSTGRGVCVEASVLFLKFANGIGPTSGYYLGNLSLKSEPKELVFYS